MTLQQQSPTGMVQFLPTVERILYGTDIIKTALADEIERLGGKRVLLLTPRSLMRSAVVEYVHASVSRYMVGTVTDVFEHVPLESVISAADVARRCRADVILTLGGGSVTDAGKALRTCLAAGISSALELGMFLEHPATPTGSWLPQISIPTTLSGAEYTRSFSATDFNAKVKRSYTDSAVASRVVLYDPTVTTATPLPLWSASGVMAIDHAVEVFCAFPPHLVGDALKIAALQQLWQALPQTQKSPDNLEARLLCQVGAWLVDHSPLRTQPVRAVATALPSHALAYELGAYCRVPYGLTACVTLAACLRWSAQHSPLAAVRQAHLARALNLVFVHSPDSEAARVFTNSVEDLLERLQLPGRLRDVGVKREDVPHLAERFCTRGGALYEDGDVLARRAEVEALLESAW